MALSREEKLERRRLWRIANREKILIAAAKYRAENPNKVRAAMKRWYAHSGAAWARKSYHLNPERNLIAAAKWKAKNPDYHRHYSMAAYYADVEAGRAKVRASRAANVERRRQDFKDWARENPEKVRDIARRRRARKIAATIEHFDEAEIFERDGWRCYICDSQVSSKLPAGDPLRAVLEHVISLAQGGAHSRQNTKCACFRCNSMKGAHLTPIQVRERLSQKEGRTESF